MKTLKTCKKLGGGVLFALILQMSAFAIDFPDGVPADAVYLTASDSSSANSLTTSSANNWSDGNVIQDTDTDKVYFVPSGLTARTTDATQTVVPIVYCAGRIYPRASGSKVITFNDLRLLGGGYMDGQQIGIKAGKITILAEDSEKPATFSYNRNDTWKYNFSVRAKVIGSKDSHLIYNTLEGLALLAIQTGSDWSEFEGTLHIADGLGIQNATRVPFATPGAVRFGTGGILSLTVKNSAPYEFGDLSFVEGGAITNTGSEATLTVSGTFDTGTNCTWLSRNPGTFGTLVLGDWLTLTDDQATPTTVLTVTNRLGVGKNITIEYAGVGASNDGRKLLLMKLSPETVAAGGFDLSGVTVYFGDGSFWAPGFLTMEDDPDAEGGLLVYATHDGIVTYISEPKDITSGPDAGGWLNTDLSISTNLWDNHSYPDGDYLYYLVNSYKVAFLKEVPTFPGKILLNRGQLWLTDSANYYVTNLYLHPTGTTPAIYARQKETHLGGNLTTMRQGTREIWQLASRSFYLDSILHGTGGLVFNSYYPDGEGSPFYLTADNSDWKGTLQPKWSDRSAGNYPASESRHTRIVVGDAKSLGGNPAVFTHNSIMLDDYAEIRFTNTTVQTAAKRGLCVTNGILRVDSGATASLTAPVTLAGTLRKVGTGTLALGVVRYAANDDLADATAPEEGKNVVLVQEGAVKGSSLDQAAVTFSDGAGIAADTAYGAMDMTSATVAAEGTISLKADANTLPEPTEPVVYPIVKVTATQNATLGPAFRAVKVWKGWGAELVSETDAKGNVTYSVRYEKTGFAMTIK